MANTKEYSIKINGLQESINAVDSLNKQLDTLEKRMSAINASKVSSEGSSKASNASSLSEEEKLSKQIEQIDAKRVAYSQETYQNYLAAKDVLKETVNDQKALAAQERLTADNYANTMAGMKQELADLKTVLNTTDLADDSFGKMTERANELNGKLKEIEQSYGQFGRNVGNYAEGVAEGLNKVKINVGGTVREFDNAKQAAKTLGNELKTLAVNGQQGTKEFKDLQKAVAQLNSDIKDATVSSRAMDNILDTMQSITAIGSVTKGFSALFGFDDTEIEKSIQKLVALQNVMQGIEKINQQMNSGEGIGAWLSKGNAAVDTLAAKLTGAAKAQESLNTATKAGKVASEGLAAAETAQATATASATVATKALSLAFKALGIGLIISAVAYLVENWEELYEWLTDTIPALKNLTNWFDKIKSVAMGVGSAIVNYMVQPLATLIKVIKAVIDGNFSDIPKIIGEGFKKTFNVVGNFQKGYNREIEKQQDNHNKKMLEKQKKANDEWLKDQEAKYGKSYKTTKEYLNKQMTLVNQQIAKTKKGSKEYDTLIAEQKDLQRKIWENDRTEREKGQKKALADSKKYAKEMSDAENDLYQLRIANMKEGLNKTLKQLEEERRQKLAKILADGKLVGERQAEVNKYYDKKIEDAKKEHAKVIEDTYRDMWDKIYSYSIEVQSKIVDITKQGVEIGRQNQEYKKSALFSEQKENASYGVQGRNQLTFGTQIDLHLEEQNNKELSQTYHQRLREIKRYWNERIALETSAVTASYNAQVQLENEQYEAEKRALIKKWNEQQKINSDWYDKAREEKIAKAEEEKWSQKELDLELLNVEKEYQKTAKQSLTNHLLDEKVIKEKHDQNLIKLEQDSVNALQGIRAEYYRDRLQELRDFQTAIANLEAKQPVFNSWGIINLKETKKNNENLLKAYKDLADEIVLIKRDLQEKLDAKLLSFDEFQQANRELDSFADSVGQKMDKVKKDLTLGEQIGAFIQSINQYVQAGLQAIQTVLNAVDEYNSAMLDKEQETLDKENEELENKLKEQEDILNKHKDAVEDIEDELANSRGDRRQHLIDQLNAEMEAQRKAAAEQKRLQKEMEAQQKKQDAIDRKRKEAEYHRNINSIIVSTAMAVANGLATQPFVPVGIAMGALATALGAVQLGLAKAAKPYAKGGLLEGPSHAQGGIPVGNTGIEVEGKEYVIRKRSTAPNMDVLDYINKSERRLSLDDFIEFYSKKARKGISNISPKTRFADGGTIPSLRTDININDRLIAALEDYAERPSVVSVVDINSRQAAVKNVQVLAGLPE